MIEWAEQSWFRDLYAEILGYDGYNQFWDVLRPWMERGRSLIRILNSFASLDGSMPTRDDTLEGLWELYALSRVSDYLMPFQARPREWDHPAVTRDQYIEFFEAMGLSATFAETADPFSPFQHEVFEVEQANDPGQPATVLDCVWPGLRFGQMLFSRCGVLVSGGAQHISKDVAERSTLYFSHRRLRRPTNDLSAGWGSNSQWRTRIRRDYETEHGYYFNVDGTHDLVASVGAEPDRDGLASEERLELCRNRCFVRTQKAHGDLWPHDDRYEEAKPA